MPYMMIFERDAMAKGREEGRVEGDLRTKRADLLRILRLRFGEVPAALEAGVEAIEAPAALDTLLDRAVLSKSLDEITLGG